MTPTAATRHPRLRDAVAIALAGTLGAGLAVLSPATATLTATSGGTRAVAAGDAADAPPDRSLTADRAARPARVGEPYAFTLVTFNVLGSNHTDPRKHDSAFPPARVRLEWSLTYLRDIGASVVGVQEIQRDQLSWLLRGARGSWAAYPGESLGWNGVQSSLLWRTDTWEFVEGTTVGIPFMNQTRLMPLVRLRHVATGNEIWVMNVHNAPQGRQGERDRAVAKEVAALQEVAQDGIPVFFVGDFNERANVYCTVTKKLGFVAPRGGQPHDGTCHPPSGRLRVDWIFGSPDVAYSRYTEDRRLLVQRITDHAVLRTRVSVG